MFVFIFLISSFALAETTPTTRLNQSLVFSDDMDFENIDLVIERQMTSFNRIGLKGTIKFGTKNYPKTVLRDSLILFKELVDTAKECKKSNASNVCMEQFNKSMNEKFAIYVPVPAKTEPGFGKKATTKFTSYYSPDLHGSRVRTDVYKNPIYRMPDAPHANYTRVAIDYKGALDGKGYEIFYVKESHYDIYLLHVQGGGRIQIENPDGSKEIKYLSYAGKNSQPFQMVYKYMMERGYLQPNDAGIPGQRRFLEQNPDKAEEIFSTCPSYVYFKESDDEPVGLNNIPLTEGRSLAIDVRIYKTMGMLNFVKTVKASHLDENGKVVKVPFARFFVSQDTGGAIRGNARCDLYSGYGPQAELIAYSMNEQGEQYFLVKK